MRSVCAITICLLLLMPVSVVQAAGISFGEPVLLDSTIDITTTGSLGSFSNPQKGLSCRGDSVTLVLVNSSPHESFWSAIRIDFQGRLLDTIPLDLPPAASAPVTEEFVPITIGWEAPYFYVAGVVASASGQTSVAYVRITEELAVEDLQPVSLGWVPAGNWVADGSKLWIVGLALGRSVGYLRITLFDMLENRRILDESRYDDVTRPYALTASGQLYISIKDRDEPFLHNLVIDYEGNVTELDSLTFSGFESSLFSSFSGVHLSPDSIAFVFFDTNSTGGSVFNCYLPVQPSGESGVAMRTVNLPFSPTRNSWGKVAYRTDNNELTAVTSSGFREDIAYFRFDLQRGLLLNSGHLIGQPAPQGDFVGFELIDSLGLYYQFIGGDLRQLRFEIAAPNETVQSTPILYTTSHFRTPSMLLDDHGLLLYAQQANAKNTSLKVYRFADPTNLVPTTSYEIMQESGNPFRPRIFDAGDTNVLFWYEDITDTVPALDTVLEQRLVLFDGDIPNSDELQEQISFYTVGRNIDFRPSFVVLDSLLYLSLRATGGFGKSSDGLFTYLRSVDLVNGGTTPFAQYFFPTGPPALLAHADSLISVSPYRRCTQYNNIGCMSYEYGYDVHKFFMDEFLGKTRFGSRSEYIEYWKMPTDVTKAVKEDELIIGLPHSKRLMRYSEIIGGLEQVADLNNYIPAPGYDCELHPVPLENGWVAVLGNKDRRLTKLILFDDNWQLIDTASIPLAGLPIEFSEFVPMPELGMIFFAYSSWVGYPYASPRLFIQSVNIDLATDVPDDVPTLPVGYTLSQNYPNPFNPSTTIKFELTRRERVSLEIFNIMGQRVRTLVDDKDLPAGLHRCDWDGKASNGQVAASGIYLYRLKTRTGQQAKKMLLLK